MRSIFSKFALAAIFGFALTFTFSCSGNDDDDGSGSSSSSIKGWGNSSSSVNQCLSLPNWGKGASGTFVDNRDNTTYKWVEIGEQTWMAENLNYRGTEPDTLGKCYKNDPANCMNYGRLYNWNTVMALPDSCTHSKCASQISEKHRGICLSGWHISSNADWNILLKFVNPSCSSDGETCACAGTKLKSAGCRFSILGYYCTDDYGFSALPVGMEAQDSSFDQQSYWWSSSWNNYNSWLMTEISNDVYPFPAREDNDVFFSVRCVKD